MASHKNPQMEYSIQNYSLHYITLIYNLTFIKVHYTCIVFQVAFIFQGNVWAGAIGASLQYGTIQAKMFRVYIIFRKPAQKNIVSITSTLAPILTSP